ncbi:unnamed protein product [Caenorhabditis nigoni]
MGPILEFMEANKSPVFETTRNVEILGDVCSDFDPEEWHLEFQKLPNKNIFLDYRLYERERIVDLITHWIENGKEIGTCWNFGRRQLKDVIREVENIKYEIGGTYRRAAIGYALILPINEDSELMVVGVQVPKNQRRALQLLVQPKAFRSSLTKFLEHFYTNWFRYTFFTVVTFVLVSSTLSLTMGLYSIPWIFGLIVISFSFLGFISPTQE